MRPSLKTMATAASAAQLATARSSVALLPPIPLYRRILRAHRRKLHPDMRMLGDQYVKSEFRAHKTVENPVHIIGFLSEWQQYAQALEGESWREEKLDQGKMAKMSDEQLVQLYDLMQTIHNPSPDDNSSGTESK
ncbi:ACN9-domain-containing protein [Eremomyces bilateralis CBS 781.70]|uniref:Succinate dehydrogenase assembly factor 3 n=1 Tax=Eremomyces bilateralis CBS 781.70 TaxID=1392243 RepID=A0A6G1FY81_9PEZI|nr:ACN9-domain-containing protein [Eremomyces bilateralis CBS 781.70]KAF1810636.1 ACN9-domain-containing protein [Eremomyces bilateralis CBS 781.70]